MTRVPFFGVVEMNRDVFAALMPQDQTLALRLMQEHGLPIAAQIEATGLSTAAIDAISSERHRVAPVDLEARAGEIVSEIAPVSGFPVNAHRALVWLHKVGGKATCSHQLIEELAGLGVGTARVALPWLIDQGYLDQLVAQKPKTPSTYRLTLRGEMTAAELRAEAAQ